MTNTNERETPVVAPSSAPALRLQSISRRFGGVEAVSDVTFDIAYGEHRVILGPNGAGKSTLFNLIAGEIRPTRGKIVLFNRDVTSLSPQYRARHGLTRTYQTTHLFGGLTTLDNLFLAVRGIAPWRMSMHRPGPKSEQLAKARQLATQVGLEAVLGRKVNTLSHGEHRQLELGMALAGLPAPQAGFPRMMILDEPAAGLSQSERIRLTELILGLDPAITVLLIEHDMDVALQIAQFVTVMHNGRIIANGTPEEIRTNPVVQALYLGDHHA